jgi:pimeloyl-ACP methyl ester carboxylesterase
MRFVRILLVAAVAIFSAWSYETYPRVGHLVYDVAARTEAWLYGLHKERLDVDGIPMVIYRSEGQGEPVLMLHGFSADKNVWVRFARLLAHDHQVIIPDLPGHGETGYRPEWSYTAPAQVERLVKLLDRLHVSKAHVIGNSMGGFIAAQFALDHPERTWSVGLVDAAGLRQPHPSEMERMLAQGHNPFLFQTRAAFYDFYPMTMAQPPYMPGFVLDAIADDYVARRDALANIFTQAHEATSLRTHVQDIHVPVWILWGRADRLIDVSVVSVWQAALPQAKVVVWDGIGHMPMVERPSDAAHQYQQFLQGLAAAAVVAPHTTKSAGE